MLGYFCGRVDRRLRPFELINGHVLADAGDPVSWIVFPETGLVSVISILVSGSQVETSVIGRDGALGFIEALGSGRTNSRLLVQVPGQALRMPADEFRCTFQGSARMQRSVLQQIELLQAESRLAIACHSIHPVEGRLCRWLLECQEVSGKDEMPPDAGASWRHVVGPTHDRQQVCWQAPGFRPD